MVHVVTTILSNNEHAKAIWPKIRELAGTDIIWWVMVDGDHSIPWHQTEENMETAKLYADNVEKTIRHGGNGFAIQMANLQIPQDKSFILLDADTLPSKDFALLLSTFKGEGRNITTYNLGAIAGCPLKEYKDLRSKYLLDREQMNSCLSLHTPLARNVIKDYRTKVPINGLENLIDKALIKAKLRRIRLCTVWVEEHPSAFDPPTTPYNQWKKQYLGPLAPEAGSPVRITYH